MSYLDFTAGRDLVASWESELGHAAAVVSLYAPSVTVELLT